MLPFKQVTRLVNELSDKDSKDSKKFENPYEDKTKLLQMNLGRLESLDFANKDLDQKFELRQFVYSFQLDSYVQIKTFDKNTKRYTCRVVVQGKKDQQEEREFE
jgi:hypothetical protein